MTIEIAALRKQFTRRAALGGAAAMVAAPAFAEECRIGPPPHEKGPLVWMDMDQVELDAAYDQAFYAPLRLEIIKRLGSTSEASIEDSWVDLAADDMAGGQRSRAHFGSTLTGCAVTG
jgi:hypothetical protein